MVHLSAIHAQEGATSPPSTRPAAAPACAAFVGKRVGTWGYNRGTSWLIIKSVADDCSDASYSYQHHPGEPTVYRRADIKDGVLSFVCNRSTGGTCSFTVHGKDLWARYSNPVGGQNNALFRPE